MKLPAEERPEQDFRTAKFLLLREDRERIGRILSAYVKAAGARTALWIDRSAGTLASTGDGADDRKIAQVAAASFEVTRLMRELFEREATLGLFDGRLLVLEMALVDEATMLATAFDARTTLAVVRHERSRVVAKLRDEAGEIAARWAEAERIAKEFLDQDPDGRPPGGAAAAIA